MNQFKKAKLKSLEAGHDVESVSGLQTAGIKQNTPELEPVEIEKPIEEPKPQVVAKVEAPKAETPSIEVPKVEEVPVVAAVVQEKPVEPAPVIEAPVKEEIPQVTIVTPIEAPAAEAVQPIYRQPVAEAPIYVQEPVKAESYIPTPPVMEQVIEPRTVAYTYAEPAKAPKKSMPNIFGPKDEAKSMRKSLVLKPTSVKKAENYCMKNGGSFNELVQTLLDNFIEEYGL